MPQLERSAVSRASSPTPYVYVSSSESESEGEFETSSPPLSPSSSPSSPWPLPVANGEGKTPTPSKMPSRLGREASAYFPTAEEEGNSTEGVNGGSDDRRIQHQAASEPRLSESPVVAEDRERDVSASVGGTSRMDEHDPLATPSNEELVLRIKALEAELQALRAAKVTVTATAAVAAVSATAVSAVASSVPGVTKAGAVDVTET